MSNQTTVTADQAVRFPYINHTWPMTASIVKGDHADDSLRSTIEKIALFSGVGIAVVAIIEAFKNFGILVANAGIAFANLVNDGYNKYFGSKEIEVLSATQTTTQTEVQPPSSSSSSPVVTEVEERNEILCFDDPEVQEIIPQTATVSTASAEEVVERLPAAEPVVEQPTTCSIPVTQTVETTQQAVTDPVVSSSPVVPTETAQAQVEVIEEPALTLTADVLKNDEPTVVAEEESQSGLSDLEKEPVTPSVETPSNEKPEATPSTKLDIEVDEPKIAAKSARYTRTCQVATAASFIAILGLGATLAHMNGHLATIASYVSQLAARNITIQG